MNACQEEASAPHRLHSSRFGSWLLRSIAALGIIICVTLLAVFSFEQYSLRPLAEYLVEQATGRAFSIEGDLDASAGRIVSIRAGRIRLANADWSSSDDFLNVNEVFVAVDLMRLFDAGPLIDKLEVGGVKLLLEQDEQGRSNWEMAADDDQPVSAADGQSGISLPIAHSQLSAIDIRVISPALQQPLSIRLDSVELGADQDDEVRATLVGAVDDRPLNLLGRIGPLSHLRDTGEIGFDVKGDFEATALEINGNLDTLLDMRLAKVQVYLQSAEISQIFMAFGLRPVASGAAQLNASLHPDGDHHGIDLTASLGSLNVEAHARLQALTSIDGASVTLSASGQDLAAAGSLAGLAGLPAQAFRLESSVALSGNQLSISETRFESGSGYLEVEGSMSQFPNLEGTNLKLHLAGRDYLEFAGLLGLKLTSELDPEPFEARATMAYSAQNGQQFTAQMTLADVGGEFSGVLTEYPALTGSHIDYRLDGRNDGLIQRLLGQPTRIDGEYSLQGKLARTGTGYSIEAAALSIGSNKLMASGTIGEDPLRSDTALALQFSGPDIENIAAIAGFTGFIPAGVASISATARAQNNAIHVDELKAQLGHNQLQATGLISLQADLTGSRAQLLFTGKDIAEVLPPDLLAYVDSGQSFELTTTLAADSGQLAISALQAKLGGTSLDASGSISMLKPLTDLSLQLDVGGPDLAAIIPEELLPYSLPVDKFSASGSVALAEAGLVLKGIKAVVGSNQLELSGTIPLATPSDGLQLTVKASGSDLSGVIPAEFDQLDFAELPYEIEGDIQLVEGILSLRQLEFSTPQGQLSGELRVSVENPRQFGHFDLRATGDNLSEFAPTLPDYQPPDVSFDLDAQGGWDADMLSIEKGSLKLDDSSLEVQGEVSMPPNEVSTRLKLSLRGDNLTDLGQFSGVVLPSDEFSIDATLQSKANSLEIGALNAQVGRSDLRGSIRIGFAEKPDIEVKLISDLIDLTQLFPTEDSPAAAAEVSPQPTASDGRVIPQLPVPVDQLNQVNLVTEVKLGELRLIRNTLHNIEIDSKLLDGKLAVNHFKATATEGGIIAQFQAAADGDRIVTSGTLEGTDIVLGNTQADTGEIVLPEMDFKLRFETKGATSRELAANLTGNAQLTGGTGRLRNSRLLGLFGSFYSELLNAVNPFVTKEPYTSISCFAAYAEIIDGVATINPGAVMQTDKLDMFTHGQVDLNTEQINLRFDTRARSGIGISVADFINPFVGVSGTLASPGLGVDSKNAMFEGGFAYATGGLSIVAKSLFNRWFGTSDPCISIEQQAQDLLNEKQSGE